MRSPNYDKFPATQIPTPILEGDSALRETLRRYIDRHRTNKPFLIVAEPYHGVLHDEVLELLSPLADTILRSEEAFKSPEEIEALTRPFLTHDRLFGRRSALSYEDYFDAEKRKGLENTLAQFAIAAPGNGVVLLYGYGASLLAPQADLVIYLDMARWEIQQRFRRKLIDGIGVHNRDEEPSLHYKRGYFLDWLLCDRLKKSLLPRIDFWIDTHSPGQPKMISGSTMREALSTTVNTPFRVVPFFDPAPWGGQWMKRVCDLDRDTSNFGWCFDCVPEENSLYLRHGDTLFELPSLNLVLAEAHALLGEDNLTRFGEDFPIRFDFLDTIGGGHLSLQVHPTTDYIRETFGMPYTQDESYYILDAEEGATVYLGLRDDISPDAMIADLKHAQENGAPFPTETYVNTWPAHKHDHFLIPAGTIHCSGAGAMVLEISATPSIFTFKLWDWGRLGLDGRPRPINIDHGARVLQWDRTTEFTRTRLVSPTTIIHESPGILEERTGLDPLEFIETRRHTFSRPVLHDTQGNLNVLNLVDGEEIIVESPSHAFDPFIVHYAETFIVPARIGAYIIRPHGRSEGKTCMTLKAYVRHS